MQPHQLLVASLAHFTKQRPGLIELSSDAAAMTPFSIACCALDELSSGCSCNLTDALRLSQVGVFFNGAATVEAQVPLSPSLISQRANMPRRADQDGSGLLTSLRCADSIVYVLSLQSDGRIVCCAPAQCVSPLGPCCKAPYSLLQLAPHKLC
jgi:hypothetical protein